MNYTFKLNNQIYKIDIEEDENINTIEIDGESREVEFSQIDKNLYSLLIDGKSLTIGIFKKGKKIQVFYEGNLFELESISERDLSKGGAVGSGLEVIAPMPSRIVKILKSEGDDVELEEPVIVVEAMKMESELKAPQTGKIKQIKVSEGDTVEEGAILVTLSASAE
ncbi:MAG: biotin/lipoyl-binding protein [Candidatus Dadabacteria bacterium]|nr:biotin/lipoyl-binding protein [Candidatus Dadabacteria bacterium]NIQ14248.1 biotin/lipoyl-binding protein [Candidatus Dadabacteria bacterium]